MKTIFTLCLSLLVGQAIYAQGCTELFISEYLEGTGNNKGFEIYNPTAEPIDLSAYTLQRWSNGASSSSDELTLVGTIPAYGTWVVVNGQTTDEDLGGGNISPAADPEMQGLANQLDNPYPAPTYMNGNDALVFVKNETTPVDMFGRPGEEPGDAWTDNADAGYTSTDGGTWLTANHTLRRKASTFAWKTRRPFWSYTSTAVICKFAVNSTLPLLEGFGYMLNSIGLINSTDISGSHSQECHPNPSHVLFGSVSHSRNVSNANGGVVTPAVIEALRRSVWLAVNQVPPSVEV